MAAQTTDLFRKTGAGTVTTLAAPGKALSATSITVGATTNYPTDTGLVIAIRVVDSAGELVAGTYTEWNAIVASSTSFTIEAAPVYGSDQVYPAGSTTQVFIPLSSSAHNDLIDGILTHADQDGTLKAGAVDVAAVLATDVVETAKIKDLNVTTAKIADGAVTSAKVAAGAVVQVVNATYSAVATGGTDMPSDDSIPQNNEGDEYMTLAITPKSATNILVIQVTFMGAVAGAAANLNVALFQDSTANALAACAGRISSADAQTTITFNHTMTAGTTSATTFKVRAGAQAGGSTVTFNGSAGTRLFGAIPKSSIVIYEYKAS